MSLALMGDSSPVATSAPTAAPASAPASAPAPAATPLTEAQVIDDLNKQKTTADQYAEVQRLAEQAQNDQVALQAVQDAFNTRIAAPAAKQIADEYTKGGAMAAAAGLLKAMKEAPPAVAASIFEAAKPTIDAIAQELGGTAFASKSLLPKSTSESLANLRKSQQQGVPQPYPANLWKIASQDEFKAVYADLSATVEIIGTGPDGIASTGQGDNSGQAQHLSPAALQVADSIVKALPYQAKDSVYFPSPDNLDPNALMSSAVTNAVSSGHGAALSLALAKCASAVPPPSNSNEAGTVLGPSPRLDTKQLLGAIGTGVQTLRTNNDKALTDFTTPAPQLTNLAERFGALPADGDDAHANQELQQALAKTSDQTPSLADPLKAKQAKVDQTAGDVVFAMNDLRHAGTDLQAVAGFDQLAGVATELQKDKETALSIGVSATAQSAVINAQLQELVKDNPSFNEHGKPPNLLWASRIGRGLVAEIAAMKISAKPEDQAKAALANISRMQPAERQQLLSRLADMSGVTGEDREKLVSGSDMGAVEKWLGGADLNVQSDAIASAANAMSDSGMKPITARGGFAPSTAMGKGMSGLGTALYLWGAWDLINTPVLPGQNPVPAHINQAFGYYVLWGAVNQGYMHASSWAQTLLVGENSALFKDKMPVDGWLDRATRAAVGRGTLFEVSGELFDAGATVLLGGIAAYDVKHGDLGSAFFHSGMSAAGGYPVTAKYAPRIPFWLAGQSGNAAAGDAADESLAAGTVAEEAMTGSAAAGSATAGGAAAGGAALGGAALGEGAAIAATEEASAEGVAAATGASALGGPASTGVLGAFVLGKFEYSQIKNQIQAAGMESFNRTFLRNLGYSPEQAKLLANDDAYGNSVGPTLQAVAQRLGISGGRMGQYLASLKDPQKLNQLVLATQNVNVDVNGKYQLTLLDHGDTIADAPAGSSPEALKAFYQTKTPLYDIPTLLEPAGSQSAQPPANAGDDYYRQIALKRETPHSIDGLIQWAKDAGIPFPGTNATGGGASNPTSTPTPTPTPTAAPTGTPTPTPSSGPTPAPSSGPAATPSPEPTPLPDDPEPRIPHGMGGKPRTPTERDVPVGNSSDDDTLSGIAQSNGVTLPELAPLNPAFDWASLGIDAPVQGPRDPNLLFLGDIIHVPVRP